jgi:hypothetical protein
MGTGRRGDPNCGPVVVPERSAALPALATRPGCRRRGSGGGQRGSSVRCEAAGLSRPGKPDGASRYDRFDRRGLVACVALIAPLSTASAWSLHVRRRATLILREALALWLVEPAAWLIAGSWWLTLAITLGDRGQPQRAACSGICVDRVGGNCLGGDSAVPACTAFLTAKFIARLLYLTTPQTTTCRSAGRPPSRNQVGLVWVAPEHGRRSQQRLYGCDRHSHYRQCRA